MNDQQIETEIQAKGPNAPRVTPQDIEANIAATYFFTAADGVLGALSNDDHAHGYVGDSALLYCSDELLVSLQTTTLCVIVLRNGFTVTGESTCSSPENFDAELGRKIAQQNAVDKIWPLMGYALKQRLHEASEG